MLWVSGTVFGDISPLHVYMFKRTHTLCAVVYLYGMLILMGVEAACTQWRHLNTLCSKLL